MFIGAQFTAKEAVSVPILHHIVLNFLHAAMSVTSHLNLVQESSCRRLYIEQVNFPVMRSTAII